MKRYIVFPFLAVLLWGESVDFSVSRTVFGSKLRVKASRRTAGAVSSITFRGVEYLNAFDHGRELQSALSFDGLGECYNPTEAGSNPDGRGGTSSTRLLSAHASGRVLTTEADLAFWLRPGQAYPQGCGGRREFTAAQNAGITGGYVMRKRVTLGVGKIANAMEYEAEFTIPRAHASATYEFATGYMPPEFGLFFTFDPAAGRLAGLSDGPGEQALPVILATADRRAAMGVWSPDPKASYGRFKFLGNPGVAGWNTVKWNCVFRAKNVPPGVWGNRCFVAVGTVEEVTSAITALYARYH